MRGKDIVTPPAGLNERAHLLVRPPLLEVMGVEHLQPAHLTQVAMEIRTVVFIETVSGGGVGTQLGEVLVSPAHWGRSCTEHRKQQLLLNTSSRYTDYITDHEQPIRRLPVSHLLPALKRPNPS